MNYLSLSDTDISTQEHSTLSDLPTNVDNFTISLLVGCKRENKVCFDVDLIKKFFCLFSLTQTIVQPFPFYPHIAMKQFEFMGGARGAPSQESWPILPHSPFASPLSLRSSYPIKFSSAFASVLIVARRFPPLLIFVVQPSYS